MPLAAGLAAAIVPAMQIDWGRTAADYASHRADFPDSFFDRLAGYGIVSPAPDGPGRTPRPALDLGTGTGSLARGLARRGWRVTGVDISADMLAAARRLTAAADLAIDYVVAPAEATGLADHGFELVSAGTCWHWFDRPKAADEAHRVLASGGWLVISAMDWWRGSDDGDNVVDATIELIAAHNPNWASSGASGLRFAWADELRQAGFAAIDRFRYRAVVPYSHAAWRGRIRASAGIGASLTPEGVAAFDRAHARLLQERFPEEPLQVPHRISAIVARRADEAA
jgi:SAM-dependent methyltransferase